MPGFPFSGAADKVCVVLAHLMHENLTAADLTRRVTFSAPRGRRNKIETILRSAHQAGVIYIHSYTARDRACRPAAIWSIQEIPFKFPDAPRPPPSVWMTLNQKYKGSK